MQHCELKGNYAKQHDKNFVKWLENQLLLWHTDFILAFHMDHETAFANLMNNAEFTNRITIFGKREDNNWNPKYNNQWFSQDAFIYYLNKACEKYEREQQNSNL